MIYPGKLPSTKPSHVQLTVYIFAYDSRWCGVRAQAFLTQEKAEEAWVAAITGDRNDRAELLRLRASDEHAFIEKMEELRDPMDNYWIFAHELDVAIPSGPMARVLRFSGTQAEVNERR
jgi:hypothetical protein